MIYDLVGWLLWCVLIVSLGLMAWRAYRKSVLGRSTDVKLSGAHFLILSSVWAATAPDDTQGRYLHLVIAVVWALFALMRALEGPATVALAKVDTVLEVFHPDTELLLIEIPLTGKQSALLRDAFKADTVGCWEIPTFLSPYQHGTQ